MPISTAGFEIWDMHLARLCKGITHVVKHQYKRMLFVGTVLEWVVQYTVLLIWGYETQSYLTAVSHFTS